MLKQPYKTGKNVLLGNDNNALVFLFAIISLVFVMLNFIKIIYYLSEFPLAEFNQQILYWFTLPASFPELLLKPWTLFTYMFSHINIWQLVSSAMWMWAFGFILQDLAGNKKLIPIYLYGGLVGGIVFLLTANLLSIAAQTAPMLGAGSAVIAIVVATTVLAPNYRLFPMIMGGLPIWILAAIFLLVDLLSLGFHNLPMIAAHIAGALVGYLYIQQYRNGRDWGAWMLQFYHWLNNLFSPEKTQLPNKPKIDNQAKLDAILDKMNREGYQYLSDQEKNFLKTIHQKNL